MRRHERKWTVIVEEGKECIGRLEASSTAVVVCTTGLVNEEGVGRVDCARNDDL
jgi:hypothetical protein